MTDTPWEPPIAGTEAEAMIGMLDRLRATFRWKTDGLDAEGLGTTVGASSLTLGGLLKHLALVEDHYFTAVLAGEPYPAVWQEHDGTDDWVFRSAAGDSPEVLYAFWDGAVVRSRDRLAVALPQGGLDQPVRVSAPDGRHANLRRMIGDLVEEYGRHTGHADLIRESVDGLVGEDPPAQWLPGGVYS